MGTRLNIQPENIPVKRTVCVWLWSTVKSSWIPPLLGDARQQWAEWQRNSIRKGREVWKEVWDKAVCVLMRDTTATLLTDGGTEKGPLYNQVLWVSVSSVARITWKLVNNRVLVPSHLKF